MKCWTKVAALLLSVAVIRSSAQSAPEGQGGAQETQARGFWTDPSTGQMWAGRDNGGDVSWKGAMKYCRNLRLAGYSDWRLPNMAELQPIMTKQPMLPGWQAPPRSQGLHFPCKGQSVLDRRPMEQQLQNG